MSLWPYHALLAGQLLLLLLGGLSLLAAFVPVHPPAAYGPPTPETPVVKPAWYLLWIFGFLKLVPASATVSLGPVTIGPQLLGGVLFSGLLFGTLTLTPWLDRSNRQAPRRFEYLEPPGQAPPRLALTAGALTSIAMLLVAAYDDELGLSLAQAWLLTLAVPLAVGAALFGWRRRAQAARATRFDPTAADAPADSAADAG